MEPHYFWEEEKKRCSEQVETQIYPYGKEDVFNKIIN